MVNMNALFGSNTFNPTLATRNPGLAFGSGDDFLSPKSISSIGNSFVQSVSPVSSSRSFNQTGDPTGFRNPSPEEILLRVANFSSQISPNAPGSMVDFKLPYLPYPYYQGVPDMGTNPDAAVVLFASTQFQNELQTVGPRNAPGFPAIDFGITPEAIDFLQGTNNFIGMTIPYQPTPLGFGHGLFPIQPPFQHPYPSFGSYYPRPPIPYPCPYPFPPATPAPWQPRNTVELAQTLRLNTFHLPDFLPTNSISEAYNFIREFNGLSESERVDIRKELANPTAVDTNILNKTGITSTGGAYKQGVANNPFQFESFLTDSNPFARTNSGLIVTNGNGNGKVEGTPERDIILGTSGRNNIIDGRGGEDDVIGSTQKDLVAVHQGDRVFTDAQDDLMFYDFTIPPAYTANRMTVVDGGDGNDTMVLTVNGNPTLESNLPQFRKLPDGQISVLLGGVQILTSGLEKFIIVDRKGNIGSVYKATS